LGERAEYTVSWDDVCRVANKELVNQFNQKFDEISVALKLVGDDLELEDCLIYHYDNTYHRFDTVEMLNKFKDKAKEISDLIQSMLDDFKEKTKIGIYIDLIYSDWIDEKESIIKIVLKYDDVVELTPQAKLLQKRDVFIDFETWSNDDY
jgi:hypothetical protein